MTSPSHSGPLTKTRYAPSSSATPACESEAVYRVDIVPIGGASA